MPVWLPMFFIMIESADLFPALVVKWPFRPPMLTYTMLGKGVPSSSLEATFLASEEGSCIFNSRVISVLRHDVEILRDSSLTIAGPKRASC